MLTQFLLLLINASKEFFFISHRLSPFNAFQDLIDINTRKSLHLDLKAKKIKMQFLKMKKKNLLWRKKPQTHSNALSDFRTD